MRSTHTYAVLEISNAAYDEIRAKLEAAGYQHAFMDDGEIDMHGIAVKAESTNSSVNNHERLLRLRLALQHPR